MPGFITYRGKPLRNPRSGRLLKKLGGNLVAPPAPSPAQPPPIQTQWPSSPHIRLTQTSGYATIVKQDGKAATIRLVTPAFPYTQLFAVGIFNTTATPSKQTWWANQFGGLFQTWGGGAFGNMGITRTVDSRDWGTYSNTIFQELNNGTFISLDVVVEIADTVAGAIKPPVTPAFPREEPFFEDFLPMTNAGALWQTFGNPVDDGNSCLILEGGQTAMMPVHPQGLNTAEYGLPEGLFEFKARYEGGHGDGTGPANVLWPANDAWPSIDETRLGEIDLGEFWLTKNTLGFYEQYMAFHWRTAAGQNADALYNIKEEGKALQEHDPTQFNVYGAWLRQNGVTLYINGKRIVDYTARGAPDWTRIAADGSRGVNHTMGVMNASSNTRIFVDWCKWTPSRLITTGFPGTVPYALPLPAPALPASPTPTPTPTPTPAPSTGTAAEIAAAQTFLSGLSIGVNVERGRAWYMTYSGTALNRSLDFWKYLKTQGFTHVRFFYPYRPTVNMSDGVFGATRPSAAQIDRLIDSAVLAVQAGLKVFVDACDIMGVEDLTSTYLPLVNAHVDLFCDRIAARADLTPDKIAVGPVNEWASANSAGDNALYNTHRVNLDTRIANKLPNHVRVTGAAGYTSKDQLVATDWAKPTANQRWVGQWHAYETTNATVAFWEGWAAKFKAFSDRMGGNPTFCGEAGLWSANDGTYRQAEWITNIGNYAKGVPLTRPTYWAITDSASGFMLNGSGTDPTIRTALRQTFVDADATIRATTGFITGTDAPATPPAGPINAGEPNWDGATEAFYHTFSGTTLDRNVWPIVYGGAGNNGVFDWDSSCLVVNNGLTVEAKFVGGRWKCGGISMGNLIYPGYAGFFAPAQVSFRARVDAGKGFGIGLILWGVDDVWDQEIDVAESPDADKQRVWMTVHGNPPQSVQDSAPHVVDMTAWHVYTVRWEATGIRFYIDGNLVRTITGTQYMPKKNMTIGIQSWVFGPNDGWSGGGPDTSITKRIQVSYVRRLVKA